MLLSDVLAVLKRRVGALVAFSACAFLLSACQFQPLYGNSGIGSDNSYGLSSVTVDEVESRVGQQVRNHLLFLLNGGAAPVEPKYQAKLRVKAINRTLANVQAAEDRTAGSVEVTVSYDLLNSNSYESVATGTRRGIAAYDRTAQNFANERAKRDAENRAAKEAAEAVRLAIASDLKRQTSR